jgi:hypothetical protein
MPAGDPHDVDFTDGVEPLGTVQTKVFTDLDAARNKSVRATDFQVTASRSPVSADVDDQAFWAAVFSVTWIPSGT